MIKKETVRFLIDHIDPLGQGVFKDGENIYFIPKTLPGESGLARVLKRKKNIRFCEAETIDQKSPHRMEPECPHFQNCPGCHFLHTDYKTELALKQKSFHRMLAPLGISSFQTYAAPRRLGYRNREQLHYNKKAKKLGLIDGRRDRIVEVARCAIIKERLRPAHSELYRSWPKLAKKSKGHVEIYAKENASVKTSAVKTSWDRPYADGGFTQVNQEMNETLLQALKTFQEPLNYSSALDLFGGDGNLARALDPAANVSHIDLYPDGDLPGDNFHSHNLFKEDSLEVFAQKPEVAGKSFELLLVDPPRAGFKLLNAWIERFRPQYVLYVSCHPQTMIRDIKSLIKAPKNAQAALLDLFPSTYHFEAAVLLELD